MNTSRISATVNRLARSSAIRAFVAGAALLVGLSARAADDGFVAHEWGTFTSLQGGDGALLSWRPLETSQLPGFVFTLAKPGAAQVATDPALLLDKRSLLTLQRMETPVIYFYTAKPRAVDVTVNFPLGTITEWFPEAREVRQGAPPRSPVSIGGPAMGLLSPAGAAPDSSRIHWSDVEILPAAANGGLAAALTTDASSSHYFAARETDAAYVRVKSSKDAPAPAPAEKFLFYRGVGSFQTPLRVTMTAEDSVTLLNTGTETLHSLFIVQVRNGNGDAVTLDQLAPGEQKTVPTHSAGGSRPLAALAQDIGGKLSSALVAAKLFPREASAMVNTWRDSWFTEEGTRVFYLLPRAWTERTLPLTITPSPGSLERVMVGRAELLSPEIESQLFTEVNQAMEGDAAAAERTRALLQRLGRFAEPALIRALGRVTSTPEQSARVYALLRPATAK